MSQSQSQYKIFNIEFSKCAECWAVPLYTDLFFDYEPSLTVFVWVSDSVLHSQHDLFYSLYRSRYNLILKTQVGTEYCQIK